MSTNGTFSSRGVSRRREERERGLAVLLTAIMLLFIIPAVGLAIDAGLLYVIRGRLTAACDAASLATARNLNMGLTLAEQTQAAIQRGTAFFTANFPARYLGTSNTGVRINVAQTSLSTLTATTTATTNAPLYFMRLLGGTSAATGAVGRASRRDVNLMLVLDRSGSMVGVPCADMKLAAKGFVNMFVNGRDTLGMVTFSSSTYIAYPPSPNFRTSGNLLTSAIDLIECTGGTNTSDSYMAAYRQIKTLNEPLALNMIVFFTDGMPTAFAAKFPIKTLPDKRYGGIGLACTSTSAECNPMPKSTCLDDLGRLPSNALWGDFGGGKEGVIAAATPATATYGYTLGLLVRTAASSSSADTKLSTLLTKGCAMSTAISGNSNDPWIRARQDIAYIPSTDLNGLSTSGYQQPGTFSMSHTAYPGRIRPDQPISVTRVAMNLADNAAAKVRTDVDLNVITYTIGLGGNGGVDDVLLRRMANDLASPIHDTNKPDGLYVYAPNSSDLNQAFARIASEILRLAQ